MRGFVRELVVVGLVGLLALIIWVVLHPCCHDSKERMSRVFLRRDAHDLLVAESAYFAAHGAYVADTAALHFATGSGARVEFEVADAAGWRAVLWLQGMPGCEIGVQGPPRELPGAGSSLAPCLRQLKQP